MKEMRDVFADTLVKIGKENEKILVLDADLNTSTRTDLFLRKLPSQFIQLGIAEQNMFGWAAGLSTFGFIPFPTTFAVFATKRACDQISISIAYPELNVKIPGCYCGISTGKAGATHQSVQDLAIMRSMPNIRVLAAADGVELEQMMECIVEYEGPVYFRVLRSQVKPVFKEDYTFNWEPVLLREGGDIAIITTGYMTHKGVDAAEILEKEGIHASVLHVPCLKPLKAESVAKVAEKCGAVVTAENHSIIGGLGSAVAEILVEHMPVPMKRIGIRDTFVETGEDDDLLEEYAMTEKHIVNACTGLLTTIKK